MGGLLYLVDVATGCSRRQGFPLANPRLFPILSSPPTPSLSSRSPTYSSYSFPPGHPPFAIISRLSSRASLENYSITAYSCLLVIHPPDVAPSPAGIRFLGETKEPFKYIFNSAISAMQRPVSPLLPS